MVMPLRHRRCSTANSRSVSRSFSAEFGSSRISRRGSSSSTRQSSTSCRSPMLQTARPARGHRHAGRAGRAVSRLRSSIARVETSPQRPGSRLTNRLASTERCGKQAELLIDDADAAPAGGAAASRSSTVSPSSRMVPLIRADDAGQHLHQRRFAGAVLADHGMDGAAARPRGSCRRARPRRHSAWRGGARRPAARRSRDSCSEGRPAIALRVRIRAAAATRIRPRSAAGAALSMSA